MRRLLHLIVIRLAMTKRKKWFAMTLLSVIARSETTKQSLTSVRHCEPKGWQICWREAISSLHIPVGVRCSGGIASLTAFARNDGMGVFARNDGMGLQAYNDGGGIVRLQ